MNRTDDQATQKPKPAAKRGNSGGSTGAHDRPRPSRRKAADDPGSPALIVGLGASAGGVEALQRFFEAVPDKHELAFIVALHLSPEGESLLPEILARTTSMPVARARTGDAIAARHVYVLSPNSELTVVQGRLRIRRLKQRQAGLIDTMFSSLAADQKSKAVGIVLSGAGHDGSFGLKAIKEYGGLTMAQGADHTRPGYSAMPTSAIETGNVDLVLPVEDMAEKLVSYARARVELDEEPLAQALKTVCAILRTRLGHDFSGYKESAFVRRIQRRMQVTQIPRVEAYLDRLRKDPAEAGALFRDLLIGVTDFFRDPEAFRALEKQVIPQLFEHRGPDDEIRIWVPGCATGEEAYSLAILLRERMERLKVAPKVQIFATDIDDRALTVARSGCYPAALLRDVSAKRLARHFEKEGNGYRVSKELRDLCIFSAHNLIRDPPFSRVDLVSCRNLMIYFKAELQSQIIPVFHYALRPGGYLFLGMSENISRHASLFAPVDKKNRIFRRRDLGASLPLPTFPHLTTRITAASGPGPEPAKPPPSRRDLLRSNLSRIAERLAPAYVVVEKSGDVLYYSTRTGKYLEPAAGLPSNNLTGMARQGLRLDLRAALRTAIETGKRATRERVPVKTNGDVQLIDLTVEPLKLQGETLYVVVFSDVGREQRPQEVQPHDQENEHSLASQLERELHETREMLQATIEELETSNEELRSSNEELMSVNEELQSTNEELETSKEELQSVNEELQTVNQELTSKIDDLDRANSDLRNLFEAIQIAIIFLDRDLVIRSFTPAVTGIFNLIPSDRGRPMTDIVSRLDDAHLAHYIREVMRRRESIERRVSAENQQRYYLMRIIPYQDARGQVEGTVVTFVDVSSVVRAEQHQKMLVGELYHRTKNTLAMVTALATLTAQRAKDLEQFKTSFFDRLHALSVVQDLLSRGDWLGADLEELIKTVFGPYLNARDGAIALKGPAVALKPDLAHSLGLVLHELVTNAVKHGALESARGHIGVAWALRGRNGQRRLELVWAETAGHPVAPEHPHGFGSDFMKRAVAEFRGSLSLAFRKQGLRCTIAIPARERFLTVPRPSDGPAPLTKP